MKKLLCIILILALCLSCVAVMAEEDRKTFTAGDDEYALLDDGTAEITNYYGSDEELVIPDALDGHPVTAIGENAFKKLKSTSITIPDGVTVIEGSAFFGARSLVKVTIPASVMEIADNTGLSDAPLDAVFYVTPGSYAEQFCRKNQLSYPYIE